MTKQYGTRVDAPIVAGNDDTDDIPSAINKQIKGAFQMFVDVDARNKWTTAFPSRLEDTTAVVMSDSEGNVAWYNWDKDQKLWDEFEPMANADLKQAIADVAQQVAALKQAGTGGSPLSVHMMHPNEQYGLKEVSEIILEPPLNTYPTPGKQKSVKVNIQHGYFALAGAPQYYACLDQVEEVASRGGKADGALWPMSVIVPSGAYIELDRDTKAIGLQEADEKDPNVTGGMDYKIAFRASMNGKAPDDGYVRAYLWDVMRKDYLKDSSGNLLGVQRFYKAGDILGDLLVAGTVREKGIQKFTMHVKDTFTSDNVNLNTDTCIAINAATDQNKTGLAWQGFELDSGYRFKFSHMWLGLLRASIGYYAQRDIPITVGDAGIGMTDTDGMHFYNLSKLKVGTANGNLVFEDDGTDIADFSFGQIFSARETLALRGKVVKFTCTCIDKDSGWIVALMKWQGEPDKYAPEIFKSRNNMSPVFEKGWTKEDSMFISEDVVAGEHTCSKEFTVPTDADNYAIVIYPVAAQSPMTLKLKQFEVDVKYPFMSSELHSITHVNEQHLVNSERHKRFVMTQQGFAGLRYTINKASTTMPVGVPDSGNADITLDTSANQIAGSSARGGEGVIKFNNDGKAYVKTKVKLWPGESLPAGGHTDVVFTYCAIDEDGSKGEPIAGGESTFTIHKGDLPTVFSMTGFWSEIENGTRYGLFAEAEGNDYAFIEVNTSAQPMLDTLITFDELKVQQ